MKETEITIEPAPPGAHGLGLSDLLKYGPVIAQLIAALTGTGEVTFVVRLLGRKRRVTVEEEG